MKVTNFNPPKSPFAKGNFRNFPFAKEGLKQSILRKRDERNYIILLIMITKKKIICMISNEF